MMLVVYSSNVGQQMQGKGLFCPPAPSSKFFPKILYVIQILYRYAMKRYIHSVHYLDIDFVNSL